jgi:hypothetical protein
VGDNAGDRHDWHGRGRPERQKHAAGDEGQGHHADGPPAEPVRECPTDDLATDVGERLGAQGAGCEARPEAGPCRVGNERLEDALVEGPDRHRPEEQGQEAARPDGPPDGGAGDERVSAAAAGGQGLEAGRDRARRRGLVEARRAGRLRGFPLACRAAPGAAIDRHEDGRTGRHEPDEDDAHQRCRQEHERGQAPARAVDELGGYGKGHGDADAGAGVGNAEGQARHAGIAASDGGRRADEGELEADGVEAGVGEDDQRHVGRHVDGQPAAGEEDHRRGQQVPIGELVVGPAEERARDRGHDQEHRPGRDRDGPADLELLGEGDRQGGEGVEPAIGDRANDEGTQQGQRQAGHMAGTGQLAGKAHQAIVPVPEAGPVAVREKVMT